MKAIIWLFVIFAVCLLIAGLAKTFLRDGPRYEEITRNNPRDEAIVAEAGREADNYFKSHPEYFSDKPNCSRPGDLGYCYLVWSKMKEIIREKYGLEWKDPSDENPGIIYD